MEKETQIRELQETVEIFGKDAVLGYEKISLDSSTRKDRQKNLEKLKPYLTNDLEKIYFAGGEPLITEEHYGILDQLIEVFASGSQSARDLFLSFQAF